MNQHMNIVLSELASKISILPNETKYKEEYEIIHNKKTNNKTLKEILKKYNLKVSGDKKTLIERLDQFFKLSDYAIRIQRFVKKKISVKIQSIKILQRFVRYHLQQKIIQLRGPAYFKRKSCINESDFLTGDTMQEIEWKQFFSYTDEGGFTFGFDLLSICALVNKCDRGKEVQNPYNRKPIPLETINKLMRLIKLCSVSRISILTLLRKPSNTNSIQPRTLETRTAEIFACFDSLGYTNSSWFFELNNIMLCKFLRELSDIFYYRSQCPIELRRQICPTGDPFRGFSHFLYGEPSLFTTETLRNVALNVLENMIGRSLNEDAKTVGCSYILCALTLVNNNAANALPWLFQSVI
jgi:hypothetical protein